MSVATLPMYSTDARPMEWRHVFAPGGYELYCFRASDARLRFACEMMIGCGIARDDLHRRAYDRYRRNPTRVRPPLPTDYPFAELVLRRCGSGEIRRALFGAPGSLRVEGQGRRLSIGLGGIEWTFSPGELAIRWEEEVRLACRRSEGFARSELPLSRVQGNEVPLAGRDGHWTTPTIAGDVSGRISIDGFDWSGDCDGAPAHRYGVTPITYREACAFIETVRVGM